MVRGVTELLGGRPSSIAFPVVIYHTLRLVKTVICLVYVARSPAMYIKLSRRMTKPTKWRPAKTHISLSICPVWSESSLCAHWVAKDPSFLHADSEDSDQTGRMPRLIWVFAGRTVILLVLSWGGSYIIWHKQVFSWRGSYISRVYSGSLLLRGACYGNPTKVVHLNI